MAEGSVFRDQLSQVKGIKIRFAGKFFKEFVIQVPGLADGYLSAMASEGYHAGVPLGRWYPELSHCLLVAVTEKRTKQEIDGLAAAWKKVLAST